MAVIPLKDMSHSENMSEESGYILFELKRLAEQVTIILDQKADKSELKEVVTFVSNKLDEKNDRSELKEVVDVFSTKLDEKADRLELKEVADYFSKIESVKKEDLQPIFLALEKMDMDNLQRSLNILSMKVDKQTDALETLGAKLDVDTTAQNLAVTDSQLDEDYEQTINDKMN